MRWWDGITDSTNASVSKVRGMVRERGAWPAAVHEVTKSRMRLSGRTNVQTANCKRPDCPQQGSPGAQGHGRQGGWVQAEPGAERPGEGSRG